MGGGYNPSLAASRSARAKAATRTPVFFYLDVPVYVYELPCKDPFTGESHTFRSRTPAKSFGSKYDFWCDRCKEYRSVYALTHQPVNRPHSTDEVVAWEQDKGILRERIARELQARGFLSTEEEIAQAAAEFGVPVAEIKYINAALSAPDDLSGPDLCRAGLHLMTPDNIMPTGRGLRRCRACYREADRLAKARRRRTAQAPVGSESKKSNMRLELRKLSAQDQRPTLLLLT